MGHFGYIIADGNALDYVNCVVIRESALGSIECVIIKGSASKCVNHVIIKQSTLDHVDRFVVKNNAFVQCRPYYVGGYILGHVSCTVRLDVGLRA